MTKSLRIALANAFGVLCTLGAQSVTAADLHCRAESTNEQKTLVELYTSDGCSSCPPANQWLSSVLASGRSSIIPISLHVTYWNNLGWRDAYSDALFDDRQTWYARSATNRFPYTPELFRNGREWQGWRGRGNDGERDSAASVAAVTLALDSHQASPGALDVQVTIRPTQTSATPQESKLQLVVLLYEDGVVEKPDAGELRGERLRHDHVVRAWKAVDQPKFQQVQDLHFVLPEKLDRLKTGLVAFLQDRTSGTVLQAIDLPNCH